MKSLRNRAFGFSALAAIALSLPACSGADASVGDSANADDAAQVSDETHETAAASTTRETTRESVSQTAPAKETAQTQQPQAAPATHGQSSDGARETHDATDSSAAAPAPVTTPAPSAVPSNTMRVSGNQLLDACGQPFVVRGVEQILGNQLPEGNDWLGIIAEIAKTGANAVRILPGMGTLTVNDVDQILTYIGEQGMVAFIDPLNAGDWYAQSDVRAMLKTHERFLIIDAYGEPQYDDIEKWRAEAKDALVRMRSLGYEVPFTVYANQFGRGLPSLFDYGAEILAADPLHNTFLGWQAYWGDTGYYQSHYGYTLDEAVDAIVASGLPIQMGLDHITDMPSTEADYGTLMRGAEENGIGWLWWDFYNPYGAENNLSEDGSANNLTSTGADVLKNHSASIANTAKLACGR